MEWKKTRHLLDYTEALAVMAARVLAIQNGEADELAWLVEHPPLYTLGTSANAADVLVSKFPTYETGRGGQVTYHGPGQRVVYLMLDLKKRANARGGEPDLRAYVKQLEQWIILSLAAFGVEGFIREGRVGVWVETVASRQSPVASEESGSSNHRIIGTSEKKIAALGVRVQKWVTSHGIAINVHPNLTHYAGIVPCGIHEFGVTSMRQVGADVGMDEVDAALQKSFKAVFA